MGKQRRNENGKVYYDYVLPLGTDNGGPLFLSQYSFLGINPKGLSDAYANYEEQTRNHALINYNYCVNNPRDYAGYGENCWGLTASDGDNGYSAHSPNNDNGVIAPTAALTSFPFTPEESMKALHFFYYKLGDKIWGNMVSLTHSIWASNGSTKNLSLSTKARLSV